MSIKLDENLKSIPKISIIVPMYNAENVIKRAIDSVKNQTFDDWELILVNDKSSDDTLRICQEQADFDSRIKVVTNEGKSGAGFARKVGVQLSKGSYIAFLDSDDYYETSYLQTLYNLITENNCQISCCSFFIAYDDKKKAIRKDGELTFFNKIEALGSLHEISGVISSMLWDKLFKREFLAEINLTEEIVVGEDYSLLVDTFENVEKIVAVNIPLYNYYKNPQGVCNSGYTPKREKTIDNYQKYTNIICKKYPSVKDRAIAYLIVQSLAVILSMTKNKNYDNRVINRLNVIIRENKKHLYKCKQYRFVYKVAAFVCSISPKILLFFGKIRDFFLK